MVEVAGMFVAVVGNVVDGRGGLVITSPDKEISEHALKHSISCIFVM